MNTTEAARAMTLKSEGDKLTAYPDREPTDPKCVWTIGRGFTTMPHGEPVKEGDMITPEEDEKMWQAAWTVRDKQTFAAVGELPQNKFDACGLFIYNEGFGRFENSTLHEKIKKDPKDIMIPAEFMKWIYENIEGKETVMGGLVIRRGREIALWLNCTLAEVATKWVLLKTWMEKENITN
jgi:GH24 family phage-related lysozyme (muramidase)